MDSSLGIATRYGLDGPGIKSLWGGGEIFRVPPEPPCGPNSLLYNEYRVFPVGKATVAWRWLSTPFFAEVKERVDLFI